MINSVKIGDIEYSVKEVESIEERDGDLLTLGTIHFNDTAIYVIREQSDSVKAVYLLHEILHGILHQRGQVKADEDEGLINALSYGLVELLRNNPALVKYLVGEDGD